MNLPVEPLNEPGKPSFRATSIKHSRIPVYSFFVPGATTLCVINFFARLSAVVRKPVRPPVTLPNIPVMLKNVCWIRR